MNTVRGVFQYLSGASSPLRIVVNSHDFDLWKKIESAFWALSGNHVSYTNSDFSFSLILDAESGWVLDYESREEMRLKKPGMGEYINLAATFDSFCRNLDRRMIIVEADNGHFKLSAMPGEKG